MISVARMCGCIRLSRRALIQTVKSVMNVRLMAVMGCGWQESMIVPHPRAQCRSHESWIQVQTERH